jgi:hypothetical protein
MVSEAELEERRQRAAQMVLESGIVTPALDYDEAEVLLDWALAEAGKYALSSGAMGDEEAQSHIVQGVNKVRRLMEMVNEIFDQWDAASRVQMVEKLTQLLSAATKGVSDARD